MLIYADQHLLCYRNTSKGVKIQHDPFGLGHKFLVLDKLVSVWRKGRTEV